MIQSNFYQPFRLDNNNNKSTFTNNEIIIPCIKELAPKFNRIFDKYSVSPIYKNSNKFNNVSLGKDKLDKLKTTNVVYKIDCQGCDATFVGQTFCSLKKRIGEHKGDIKYNRESSALALHTMSTQHEINFDNVRILDTVKYKKQREFVEMLNIRYYPK